MRTALLCITSIFLFHFPLRSNAISSNSLSESNKKTAWKKIHRYARPIYKKEEKKQICNDFLEKILESHDKHLVSDFKNRKLFLDCSYDLLKYKDGSIYILFSKILKKGHNKKVSNAIDISNPKKSLVALVANTKSNSDRERNLRENRITEEFSFLASVLKPYQFEYFPGHYPTGSVISIYDKYETTLQKFANRKTTNLRERWYMIQPIIKDYIKLQKSLIHRDIKFSNIVCKTLLNTINNKPNQRYKCALIDFEFALRKEDWEDNKRITQMLGTTVNMAPEIYNHYTLSKHFWSHLVKRESFAFGMILIALFGYRPEYEQCLDFLERMYKIQKSKDLTKQNKQNKNRAVLEDFFAWHEEATRQSSKKSDQYVELLGLLLELVNPRYIQRPTLEVSQDKIDSFLNRNPHLETTH